MTEDIVKVNVVLYAILIEKLLLPRDIDTLVRLESMITKKLSGKSVHCSAVNEEYFSMKLLNHKATMARQRRTLIQGVHNTYALNSMQQSC